MKNNKLILYGILTLTLFLIPLASAGYTTVGEIFSNFSWYSNVTNDNFTISAWVNGPFSVFSPVIRQSIGYSLIIDSNNKLNLTIRNETNVSNFASSTSILTNSWNHVAATYNGTDIVLYVNSVGTTASYSGGYSNGSSWAFGFDSSYFFNGIIDEVRIYNTSLTSQQISNIFQATNPTFQEVANVTINATIDDQDTNSTNLYYKWLVDGVVKLQGFAQNFFSYIYNTKSSNVTLIVNDTDNLMVTQYWNVSSNLIYPLINLTYPTNKTYNSVQSLLNYTIVETNPNNCWYTTDLGVTNTSITCGDNVTGLDSGQGAKKWTVYINDSASQINSSSVSFFVDSILPVMNITYPKNITYNINVSNLNYTINETNLGSCWYSRNRGIINSSRVNAGINFTNVTSIEGTNNWTVYCNDTLNNQNSTTIVFHKDTVNPSISIVSPREIAYYEELILFNISTLDTYGISSRWYSINGASNVSFGGEEIINFPSDGEFNVTFWVNDTTNNINSSNVTFTKTNIPQSYSGGTDKPQYSKYNISNQTNVTIPINLEELNKTLVEIIKQNFDDKTYKMSRSLLGFIYSRGYIILFLLAILCVLFILFLFFKDKKK